ncbi:MAG: hypothetical protein WHU93_00760 [Arcobacteraceae bacterium]
MIVVVKRTDYKKLAIKILSVVALVGLFAVYYFYMGDFYKEFGTAQKDEVQTQDQEIADKIEQKAKAIESIIYDEAVVATSLLGNQNIKDIKIHNDRLLIVANPQIDLEPIMIRYGVLALVQNTKNDVKIAVDLASIVQSRYIEDDDK